MTNGHLESDTTQDVLKTIVLERHHATGTKGAGFVKGFGIKRGAMASTVAHDAHNLLVVGTNDDDMALAANTLINCGCDMPSPFMTMALIPLACLPDLRLTNRGLVDCRTFQFVPLVVEE